MRRAVLISVCVLALACRRSRPKAEIRPDLAPSAKPSASPTHDFEAFLREATALARQGGHEVKLLWVRGSCADKDGRLQTTCAGKTWSGTPVFGNVGTFLQSTGFFSAELQRVGPGGVRDHFGVTSFGRERTTSAFKGDDAPRIAGPSCTFAQALAHATARGFSVHAPFKIIFETGDATYPSQWRFLRDERTDETDVVDDCSVAPKAVLRRSFMEKENDDCYRDVKCATFDVKPCPATWEGMSADAATSAKLAADSGETWCCYGRTTCEFPAK